MDISEKRFDEQEQELTTLRAKVEELTQELDAQVAASTKYVNALSFTRRDLAAMEKERSEQNERANGFSDLCGKQREQLAASQAENAGLKAELERERIRLAACGSAALGYYDGCNDEYKSAALDDVLRLRKDAEKWRNHVASKS